MPRTIGDLRLPGHRSRASAGQPLRSVGGSRAGAGDKVWREDLLLSAYALVKANKGARPRRGRQSFDRIESEGQEKWLEGIRNELPAKTYQPQAVGWVMIPKARWRRTAIRYSDDSGPGGADRRQTVGNSYDLHVHQFYQACLAPLLLMLPLVWSTRISNRNRVNPRLFIAPTSTSFRPVPGRSVRSWLKAAIRSLCAFSSDNPPNCKDDLGTRRNAQFSPERGAIHLSHVHRSHVLPPSRIDGIMKHADS